MYSDGEDDDSTLGKKRGVNINPDSNVKHSGKDRLDSGGKKRRNVMYSDGESDDGS